MNKKGFTLIELLAVIVILGVLMTIAIPAVSRYIEDAKKQAFVINVANIIKTVKSKAAYDGKTKCYATARNIELEKGKLTSYTGFIYIDEKNGNLSVSKIWIYDEKNKYFFNLNDEESINKSNISKFNGVYIDPDTSTYSVNCLQ